jgi:hypothetical protein
VFSPLSNKREVGILDISSRPLSGCEAVGNQAMTTDTIITREPLRDPYRLSLTIADPETLVDPSSVSIIGTSSLDPRLLVHENQVVRSRKTKQNLPSCSCGVGYLVSFFVGLLRPVSVAPYIEPLFNSY